MRPKRATPLTFPLVCLVGVLILGMAPVQGVCADSVETTDHAEIIRRAAAERRLCFRLTTSEEIKTLLGKPVDENVERDGGMEKLTLDYGTVKLFFNRMRRPEAPFTLLFAMINGQAVDIGQGRQITLRHEGDLMKFDRFRGFSNVSLAKLDLREHLTLLQSMPFDSRTVWPAPERLPEGFDPKKVFEQGKNPGLGVRTLHQQGIDGKGVGIAIIDQPMAKDHPEYANRIKRYDPIEVPGVPPQMHGPGVTSLAVGQQCGVAPGADLYYYAIPMWKWKTCRPYANVIQKILRFNEEVKPDERIRVVSISTGRFPQWPDFADWQAILEEASQRGILVLTCSTRAIRYVPVNRASGKDPEDPNSYVSVISMSGSNLLGVPAGNSTTAGHEGANNYVYWTEPGMSWATPYLAGLAALAFQVDAEISPDRIMALWRQTAVKTEAACMVNPTGFIAQVKAGKASRQVVPAGTMSH